MIAGRIQIIQCCFSILTFYINTGTERLGEHCALQLWTNLLNELPKAPLPTSGQRDEELHGERQYGRRSQAEVCVPEMRRAADQRVYLVSGSRLVPWYMYIFGLHMYKWFCVLCVYACSWMHELIYSSWYVHRIKHADGKDKRKPHSQDRDKYCFFYCVSQSKSLD